MLTPEGSKLVYVVETGTSIFWWLSHTAGLAPGPSFLAFVTTACGITNIAVTFRQLLIPFSALFFAGIGVLLVSPWLWLQGLNWWKPARVILFLEEIFAIINITFFGLLLLALAALEYLGHFTDWTLGTIRQSSIPILSFLGRHYRNRHYTETHLTALTTTHSIKHCGNPGPKSRGKHQPHWLSKRIFHWLLSVFLLIFYFHFVLTRGEGCVSVMGDAEASELWIQGLKEKADAKQHDIRPEISSHTIPWHPAQTQVTKRSIKRAYARACKQGIAWYKGRCFEPRDFPRCLQSTQMHEQQRPTDPPTQALIRCNRNNQDHRKFRILNWNAGGLTSSKLDEIKIWLEANQIELAVICETRMTFENEWMDSQWLHVHTGLASQRGAGVLCLVSRRLCKAHQLRWRIVTPGRLMHVQLQLQQRSIDVIACYQYTQATGPQRKIERQAWWNALDGLLQGLASRHILCLAGDFNTSSPQCQSHAGPSFFRWDQQLVQGAQHEDQGRFMSLLRAHGLVALNTWDPGLGPTFFHDGKCSRIDYIITRKNVADGLAKQVKYAWDAPFCGSTGHAPMIGQLRKLWIPPSGEPSTTTIGQAQRRQGHLAYRAQSEVWQQFLHETTQHLMHRFEQAQPSDPDLISDWHHIACQTFTRFFPCHEPSGSRHDPDTLQHVWNKWQHRKLMLALTKPTLRNVVQAWFHLVRFQRLKRAARTRAVQVRQLRFQEVIESAQAAAQKHDSHSLFQIINRYSPKQPRRRMQLRNIQGQIASPMEETAMLKQFIADTWHGPSHFPAPEEPLTCMPFTLTELTRALQAIPATKAVARPCAPGIVWKSLATQIAPALYSTLCQWWEGNTPYLPRWFKDSWILLIPKPNKPPVHPRALRPLALQEPLGKTLVGILASKAQHAMLPGLTCLPLWSYLPWRSTQDALLRVSQHCRAVRTMLAMQRSTPFSREQKTIRYRVAGDIGVFLDIERAFDMVNRARLFSKLATLGVPQPIAQLLIQWHQDTRYHLAANGVEEPIAVGRGLRQGCKAAPLLWNLNILIFLTELSHRTGPDWTHRCLNIYADDGQMGDVFCSGTDLQALLAKIRITLDLLQEHGMTINSAKCTVLLAMTGTAHRKLRASLTTFRDGKEWLLLPAADKPTIWLPVHDKVIYLGAVMSYKHMEDQTMMHRIQLSRIAFGRLSRWLKGKRGLPRQQRLQLWATCVYPVLSYGLCAIGITPLGISKLQQHMYSMLRQILGNHAYHTGDSHQQALHRQGIALPLEWVIRTVDTLLQSASQRLLYATDSDIVHHLDWSHLHQLKACLEMHLHTGPAVPVTDLPEGDLPPEPIYQCHICPFRAADVASFRRHCTIVHGTRMNRQIIADHTKYMLNGLPQCRFCFKTFTTWRSFNIHIQRGCQVLLAGPAECWHQPFADLRADPVPGHTMFAPKQDGPVRGQTVLSDGDLTNLRSQEWGSRILTIVGTKNWHHMTGEPAACTYLASRCCLCDQYLGRTQDLNHHLKVYHPEFWPNTAAKGKQLTLLHGEEVPCPFCHALFSNMHQCTVWTQMALLLIYGGGQNTMETTATQPGLQCELCHMTLDTQDALHSHLLREHRLVSASFNPARDCLGGEPACNHCEALFDNIESLRSHINKGKCQRFDPNLPTEVLGIQPEWTAATCEGKLADILRDPHARLRLTLQCQNCSSRYTRASDVACHLQSSHTSLWNASQGLTAILVSMLYNAVGCLCNPSVSQARANHVCLPIRQLAMQHLRLNDVVLFPRSPTEEELTHLFSPGLARADRFMLERLMTTLNIQAFWQDAAVLTLTRSTCLLCSATMQGPDLVVHMYEAHQCGEDVVKFLIQQLVPKFQQENANDCQCDACLQVFNTPRADSLGPM